MIWLLEQIIGSNCNCNNRANIHRQQQSKGIGCIIKVSHYQQQEHRHHITVTATSTSSTNDDSNTTTIETASMTCCIAGHFELPDLGSEASASAAVAINEACRSLVVCWIVLVVAAAARTPVWRDGFHSLLLCVCVSLLLFVRGTRLSPLTQLMLWLLLASLLSLSSSSSLSSCCPGHSSHHPPCTCPCPPMSCLSSCLSSCSSSSSFSCLSC